MKQQQIHTSIDQSPFTISPGAMSDNAPPPPYSSLYPGSVGHHPSIGGGYPPTAATAAGTIQMNSVPMSHSFYGPQNGLTAAPPPLPGQMMAPPPPAPAPPQIMINPNTLSGASQLYPGIIPTHQHHYIPTSPTAGQPFLYQTVPTAYGPMIAPIQLAPNSPPMMIPTECFIDPRLAGAAAARFDELGRHGAIPIPTFGMVPQSNHHHMAAMMFGASAAGIGGGAGSGAGGHNGTMFVSKPKKSFY